jgi:hypothetical protein
MYNFICEFCKKKFKSRNHIRRYCSLKCRNFAHKERPGYWTGKKRGHLSKEWRRKISLANKGKIRPKGFSEKCRQRMLGKKLSLKTRKKLSIAHKGKPAWNKGKKCPQISKAVSGKNNHQWKGGKIITSGKNKYILIKNHKHPFATKTGYILEHRLVMEKHLGRYLKPEEIVHHINRNTLDNKIENLKLFFNNSEHSKIHHPKGYQVHLMRL